MADIEAVNADNIKASVVWGNEDGRVCSMCGHYKYWQDFHSHSDGHNGYNSACRSCKYKYYRGGSRYMQHHARIVKCPDNEYPRNGYLPAAEFGLTQLAKEDSLTLGYFPSGMVIEYRGREYEVDGTELVKR